MSNRSLDAKLQSLSQFRQFFHFPSDVVILPRIKVNFAQFILAAKPNDLLPQTKSKACFKINPSAITGKISNEKLAFANCGNNFIVNSVIVVMLINPKWFVSSIGNPFRNAFRPQLVGLTGKHHRYERQF